MIPPLPNVDQQLLDRILDKFPVRCKIGGVVEQRAVQFVGKLAKRKTISGLGLLPEIQKNYILLSDALFLVQILVGQVTN